MFIPKAKTRVSKALQQCEATDVGKLRMVAKDLTQPVERYAAVKMMHVVYADVSREPT
jgi:hypothetical protein